jgi:hypothetical protein
MTRASPTTKMINGTVKGAAILALLAAATCDGPARVRVNRALNAGQCILGTPTDTPTPAALDDVLQLANGSNVNDFIQCRVVSLTAVPPPNFIVDVSASDAIGHDFVEDVFGIGGSPALVFNLSR